MGRNYTRHQQAIVNTGCTPAPGVHIVEACAGSGKSTVLTAVAAEAAKRGRKSLFISLTNSVRHELCGLLNDHLHITPLEESPSFVVRESAHHVHYSLVGHEESIIHVATIDSWVHACLEEVGFEQDHDQCPMVGLMKMCEPPPPPGHLSSPQSSAVVVHVEDYPAKRKELLRALERKQKIINNLNQYDLFFLDEVQDLDSSFLKIAAHVCNIFTSDMKGGAVYFAGDNKQQIFGPDDDGGFRSFHHLRDEIVAMGKVPNHLIFKHELNMCFRCPPNHLRLVNRIFPKWTKTRWPKRKDDGERPILRLVPPPHHGGSRGTTKQHVRAIADEIGDALMSDYRLEDIVFVAPFTRGYGVYCELENYLSERFCRQGKDRLAWLYSDEHHCADWARAKGQVTLSSIHANKGRTHRVVVVLGLVDGTLPSSGVWGSERIEECLLYVALTRSCSRLVIVSEENPKSLSYFIRRNFRDGRDLSSLCEIRRTQVGNYTIPHDLFVSGWQWDAARPLSVPASSHLARDEGLIVAPRSLHSIAPWWNSEISHDEDWTVTTTDETSEEDSLPAILRQRNLLSAYSAFGILWLRREIMMAMVARATTRDDVVAALMPLSLVELRDTIPTGSRALARSCGTGRNRIVKEIPTCSCDAEAYDVVMSTLPPDSSQAISQIELCSVARALRLTPRARVMYVANGDLSTHKVMGRISAALEDYADCGSDRLRESTMWILALATCGAMHGGKFSRPWVRMQLDTPHLTCAQLISDGSNIPAAAEQLARRITYCDRIFNPSGAGGREFVVDYVLNNGTMLVKVVCPALSGPNTINPQLWILLILCAAEDENITSVGILNLSSCKLARMNVNRDDLMRFCETMSEVLPENKEESQHSAVQAASDHCEK